MLKVFLIIFIAGGNNALYTRKIWILIIMKKWKKSGRKRKKKTYLINILFDLDKYEDINKYRIKHNYSWSKLASVAIKEAVNDKKLEDGVC